MKRSLTPHQALWLSIHAAVLTIILKWTAWRVTDSVGFLSDALESFVNLAGAGFALLMVIYARRPADADHPYGHGKAEYFSSAFEGALIAAAAVGICIAAVQRLRAPQPLDALGLGTALSVAATLVNLVVARLLIHAGRAARSLATEADGRHLMTDVWTTVGVIVGIGIAAATRQWWLDPIVAMLVALNILVEGWKIVRRSVDGLMDAALADDVVNAIESTLRSLQQPGVRFVHLRTRRAGANRFAFVEMQAPAAWPVTRAHDVAAAAERAVAAHHVTLAVRIVPES